MSKLYVVHCVDTEGPMNESINATFERIREISGIDLIPSEETLELIQEGKFSLDGKENNLSKIFSKRLLSYNKGVDGLYHMLDEITSDAFRNCFKDSYGNGWKYSWFVMDHINYDYNPRNRITGYNAIYDLYKDYYSLNNISNDEFQWHIHAEGFYREGNRSGDVYWNSEVVMNSLAHRLIDRGFFPMAVIAGQWRERIDSNLLFEQLFPYDFTNKSMDQKDCYEGQKDAVIRNSNDWDRAPSDWSWYHPSHDDYQVEGNCRRVIFRSLNVASRINCVSQYEVDKAFKRVNDGADTILAIDGHDFRDMRLDVEEIYEYIKRAERKYPKVKWEIQTASEAAKRVLNERRENIEITIKREEHTNDCIVFNIESSIPTFGAQPFFCIKMRGGRYVVDSLSTIEPFRRWRYSFSSSSILPDDVDRIGIAANSQCGSGTLKVFTMKGENIFNENW